MAFFSNDSGKNYFGVFYSLENDNSKTGFFHELSNKQLNFFKRCYKLSAFFIFINFIFEILFFLSSQILDLGWYSNAWKFHLLVTPIPLVFLAMYIFRKPKIHLQNMKINILQKASKSVYVTMIFSFLSMALTFLWMDISGISVDGIFIWVIFFFIASIFSAIRIIKISKY